MSILESSSDYQEITRMEAVNFVTSGLGAGWMDPEMPIRQYNTVVAKEIESYTHGGQVGPYDALIRLMMRHPLPMNTTILDVGAASGYYAVVLANRGFRYRYTAYEASPYFQELAEKMFHVPFICGDASNMPFDDRSYDVVLSGGMLMHTLDYAQAIREMKRVAGKQLILHRTPVACEKPTRYFIKKAYGLPCLEIHFNESELLSQVADEDWELTTPEDVTWDEQELEGQISYLFKRRMKV